MGYRILADLVLVAHFGIVLFIIFGLVAVWIGAWRRWEWVRVLWFRVLHLAAIAIVALQAWGGVTCPLTKWENALRQRAGDAIYAGSFVAHWVSRILFYEAEQWVFTLCYTAFGALVVLSWIVVRPRRPSIIARRSAKRTEARS